MRTYIFILRPQIETDITLPSLAHSSDAFPSDMHIR